MCNLIAGWSMQPFRHGWNKSTKSWESTSLEIKQQESLAEVIPFWHYAKKYYTKWYKIYFGGTVANPFQ